MCIWNKNRRDKNNISNVLCSPKNKVAPKTVNSEGNEGRYFQDFTVSVKLWMTAFVNTAYAVVKESPEKKLIKYRFARTHAWPLRYTISMHCYFHLENDLPSSISQGIFFRVTLWTLGSAIKTEIIRAMWSMIEWYKIFVWWIAQWQWRA